QLTLQHMSQRNHLFQSHRRFRLRGLHPTSPYPTQTVLPPLLRQLAFAHASGSSVETARDPCSPAQPVHLHGFLERSDSLLPLILDMNPDATATCSDGTGRSDWVWRNCLQWQTNQSCNCETPTP